MAFETMRRLRFGDCDPSGIAYFPAYMDMLVGVTEDLFEAIGWPWPRLAREWRITTPTVRLEVTFARPGFEGDRLAFRCRIGGIGNSSLDLSHEISAVHALWRAEQRLVAVATDTRRPLGWPDPVRAALAQHLDTANA